MICEKCKKHQATVHITKIINSKKTEMHLCGECAKTEQGVESFLNPYGILKNIMDIESEFSPLKERNLPQRECNVCHRTLEDFEQSGKVGCSNCYSTFREDLEPIIRRIHSSIQHVKNDAVPKRETSHEQDSIAFKTAKLKAALKNAVAKEDYEQAATLRDEINALKEKSDNKEDEAQK